MKKRDLIKSNKSSQRTKLLIASINQTHPNSINYFDESIAKQITSNALRIICNIGCMNAFLDTFSRKSLINFSEKKP